MSEYRIRSVNTRNAIFGDQNTQVNFDDQLAKLDVEIDRHAQVLPDVAAAHRALNVLRGECTAQPLDANRITRAAGELAAATAPAPALRDEIEQLIGRIPQAATEGGQ